MPKYLIQTEAKTFFEFSVNAESKEIARQNYKSGQYDELGFIDGDMTVTDISEISYGDLQKHLENVRYDG